MLINPLFSLDIIAGEPIVESGAVNPAADKCDNEPSALPVIAIGNPAAPLKITILHSLNCPHCIDFKVKVLPEIQEEFIDKGQVYLVFVDFPTTIDSIGAAKLAWASQDIQQYKIISGILSEHFEIWSGQKDWEDHICKIVNENVITAMPEESCRKAIADDVLGRKILKHAYELQQNYKIDFVPAFIVNNKLHTSPSGSLSVADIKNALEELNVQIKE